VSTGSLTQPATYPAPGPLLSGSRPGGGRKRGLFRLRDARIRSKLALILLVPLLAVLTLAALRLVEVGGQAYDASQVQSLARLSTTVSQLTQSTHRERMAGAQFLASRAIGADAYNSAIQDTDARISSYVAERRSLTSLPVNVRERLDRIDDHLRTLDGTRQRVLNRNEIAVSDAVLRYGVVIADLVGYVDVLGQIAGQGETASELRGLAAFARAKAGAAGQEAIAYAGQVAKDTSTEQVSALIATQTAQQDALTAFALAATPEQRKVVDSTVTGDAVTLADQVTDKLVHGGTGAEPVVGPAAGRCAHRGPAGSAGGGAAAAGRTESG
jgi:hypothetical protein